VLPVAAPAIRFGDVTAHADSLEIDHHLIAVIALVGDHFLDLTIGRDALHLLGGLDQRLDAGGRVARIRILDRDGDEGAGLEIHGVLGFMRQVRPAVFHLGDFSVGIERMRPIVVGPFLRACPISARQSSRVGVSIPDACASCVRNS